MTALLVMVVAVASSAAQAPDASKVALSAPAPIVEFDTGKLKGNLVRLAWAPETNEIYLQTAELDGSTGGVKLRHFLLALDGKPPRSTDHEPSWAAAYWMWKSAQAAPGRPALRIGVEQQEKRVTSTSTPSGGDLARGGGADPLPGAGVNPGMSVDDAARAAEQSQMARVFTLKLKGQVIGEFVNVPATPGSTFSWGPQGSGLIAFAKLGGQLVVMDEEGRQQEVEGTRDVLLPAWTGDGKRLAWLEKRGRKKVELRVADVTIP